MSFDWRNWKSYIPTVSFPGEGLNRSIQFRSLASGLEAQVSTPEPAPAKPVPARATQQTVPASQSSTPTRTTGYEVEGTENRAIVDQPKKKRLDNAFYMLALASPKGSASDANMQVILINNAGDHSEVPRIVSMPRTMYDSIKDELPKGWRDDAVFDMVGLDLTKYGKNVRAYSPGLLNMKRDKQPGDYEWLDSQDSMDFRARKRIPAKDVAKPATTDNVQTKA